MLVSEIPETALVRAMNRTTAFGNLQKLS